MTLVSQLREANPVIAPAGLSERANADLRTILGTDDVPVPRSPRPGRARWRWLVLGLAAALVAGGITVGVTLPGRHTTALPAWAGPITATVVSGTISPVAYGVSMTFDFPLPEQIGRPGLHLVERIWINDPTR
ncbi:MAG: hypothetical protein FWC46_08425, partial [Actinomycetia bacterium]|nr:hypothetical protein [Actinomycetes bacterium]